MRKIIFICLAILFFSTTCLFAVEQFPFIGEVKVEKVNVRAGGNINFESIFKLNKGDRLVVVDKKYNWYKIELPKGAICYISSNYVQHRDNNLGVVTADKVNLRARAGETFSILEQLNKGDEVKIIAKINDWFKIAAPDNCFGWVHDKFLSFYSDIIEEEELEIIEAPLELVERQKEYGFEATGTIKSIFCLFDCKGTHKLLDADNKTICFLRGDQSELNGIVGSQVQIFGDIVDHVTGIYPLIEVKKLNLIQ